MSQSPFGGPEPTAAPEEMPLLPPLHRSWADSELAGYVLACILSPEAGDVLEALRGAGYSEQEASEVLFAAYLTIGINAAGRTSSAEEVAQAMERSAARVRAGESEEKALRMQARMMAVSQARDSKEEA